MSEFKRKKNENFESFLRRFNTALIRSQKLKIARAKKYLNKKDNKSKQKKRAIVGKKIKEKNEYLKKIGKIKEDLKKKW